MHARLMRHFELATMSLLTSAHWHQMINCRLLQEPHPCCDGYFCPPALTCMMPCPLGAYCIR